MTGGAWLSSACLLYTSTAAEKYEFEPMFLAFSPDGTADMYLNLIIGLAYKWYDQEKIDEMCIRDRFSARADIS